MTKQTSETQVLNSNHKKEEKKMKCFMDKKRLPCLGILIAVVLIMTPVVAVAGGGEPGDSCPGGGKYAAPPYMGNLMVNIIIELSEEDQDVVVSGSLEQVGKSDHVANLGGAFFGTMTLEEFQNLKPGNIRMTCLENTCVYPPFVEERTCPFPFLLDDQELEVVGVGNMKWLSPTSFNATFIIMPLE